MKSNLFKAMAIIMGMMISFSLTSCGDDNDDIEPETPEAVAYYDVTYTTDLNENWFKFFDVSVIYVNMAGVVTTEEITTNIDIPTKIEADMAPRTIIFKIHVTRKASVPEVDPDKPVDFKGKAKFFIQSYAKDGSKGDFWGLPTLQNTNGSPISGKDLEKFLEKYADKDIFSRTEEIKK